MNIILKNFKENLINNHKVTPKIANVRITNHHFKWWFALTLKGYGTSLGLSPTI